MHGYPGLILKNINFSPALKKHAQHIIATCSAMDDCNMPPIPYLAAWRRDKRKIWYEYASPRLSEILGCKPVDLCDCMRENVIDRREYRYVDSVNTKIEEDIITHGEISAERLDLREKGAHKGSVEAIYKIMLDDGQIWLKDQAVIRQFPQDDIYLSQGCLTDVTKEMEQKELLERIGYYDELTGLPRRTIMDRIMEINAAQFCRGHLKDFCFILMDIDHFKKINDTLGHPAGDYVLATMADIMSSAKRKEDELGRFGGEEFYGICQGGLQTGMNFTERLRRLISSHRFTWEGTEIKPRFSAGVASAGELKKVTEKAIVKLADQRLYMAKARGRNCTVGA